MSRPFIAPIVLVGEVQAGEAARAKSRLEAIINSVNRSSFDIGELCHEIKTKGLYAPYTTFQEFSRTLKIKPRKIQYLTRIAGVFEQVGIPRSQFEPLGVARCREITSLDPQASWVNPETGGDPVPMADFIRGFVEKGEEIEMDDLKRHVRTLKGFVGDNDLVWVNLCLTRSVYDNVWTPAVEKAKALIGSVGKDDEGISKDAGDGAVAEIFATNFLNDPNVAYSQLGDTYPEDDENDNGADEMDVAQGYNEPLPEVEDDAITL